MHSNVTEHAATHGKRFYFVANSTALDFVNTAAMDGGEPIDLCTTWDDVVEWAQRAALVNPLEADALRSAPEPGRQLEHAHRLRAELRSMSEHLAGGGRVPEQSLAVINAWLGVGGAGERLVTRGDAVVRDPLRPPMNPAFLFSQIARSAADLLTSVDPVRVRRCAGASCVLWFVDVSKNGARRWCSMDACGNRTKAAAFYRRRKDKRAPDAA